MFAHTTLSHPTPELAGTILRSLTQGNADALACALDRVVDQPHANNAFGEPCAEDDEGRELIAAIAAEMRVDVRRWHGRPPADAVAVYLPLLKNLAARRVSFS